MAAHVPFSISTISPGLLTFQQYAAHESVDRGTWGEGEKARGGMEGGREGERRDIYIG